MVFGLYDAQTKGNQVGYIISNATTLVNGIFTELLDFGPNAFNGEARWLDITVTEGSDTETLSPRVQVLPSPYAIFASVAGTVTNGAIMNSQLGSNAVGAENIQSNSITPDKLTEDPAGLFYVTGGEAFMTNTVEDQDTNNTAVPTLTVNGYVQSTLGGFIFPDGTMQATATPLHGITNFDAATNFDRPVSNLFTAPAGVTQLYVEAWGGGGGGGGISYYGGDAYTEGGSGGNSGYARGFVSVTPLETYIVEAGKAGTNGTSPFPDNGDGTDGTDGGDTFIETGTNSQNPNTVLFLCTGGGGGGAGTETANGPVGASGQAEPSAGVQRAGGSGFGPLGSLQPALGGNPTQSSFFPLTYGSGGFYEAYTPNAPPVGGCIIIQW